MEKWQSITEKRAAAGRKSAEIRRKVKEIRQQNSTSVNNDEQTATNSTVNDNDNVNVNDNDNVNENDKPNNIEARKLKFSSTLKPYLSQYGKEMLIDFFNYWTEPNRSNKKFRAELERTWDTAGRLRTWAKNSDKFDSVNKRPSKVQGAGVDAEYIEEIKSRLL